MPGKARRAMMRLKLTETQKKQIRKATGREVNVLELWLQGWPEAAAGQEGAAPPDMPAGPDQEPAAEPSSQRPAPQHR